MQVPSIAALTVMPLLALTLACGGSSEGGETAMSEAGTQVPAPDTTAVALQAHLQAADYRDNWVLWPGMGRLYSGQQPHGMLLTTYLNELAAAAVNAHRGSMPAGAIVVKENYMPDSTLAAVTIMYKAAAGYNPEHNDWFFVKRLANGQLDTLPNGAPMEGRVPGCQQCHVQRAANDYIFTGSLSESM